ncbi:hypothetical protein N9N67_08420 [Bacteriovoracaceae bacterium]|nr:hypothetical protein [Bacteriovoracaceae bacterium]
MEEKKISSSIHTSPLKIKQDYYRYHFSLLIPDEEVPFAVSVFFKGKYLEIVKRGEVANLKLIASMYIEKNYFFYILQAEKEMFDIWLKKRHHFHVLPKINLSEQNNIIEHKIKEYLKYADDCFRFTEETITSRQKKSSALSQLREVCFHPSMRWFFADEWNSESVNHCARVSILTLLLNEYLGDDKIDCSLFFVQASMIHELCAFAKHEISYECGKSTLELLKEKQLAFDQRVINYMKDQLELYSGLGIPNGKKFHELGNDQQLFSIVNYFDHHRHSFVNLTKAKSTAEAINKMNGSKEDFNPLYFQAFLKIIEQCEILS